MTAIDWKFIGWVWIALLSATGVSVLAIPDLATNTAEWFHPGQGTALQLIAAGIIFAAVIPTLAREGLLVSVAGMLTAVFGYLGTMIILAGENAFLLSFVLVLTLYPAGFTFALLVIIRLIQKGWRNFDR